MIRSMTGYGKAEALLEGGKLTVEIRCINGKNADISVKSSLLPKDREMQVRKLLAERLQRGTVDMFLTWEPLVRQAAAGINTELAASYFAQLQELGGRLPLPDLGDEDSPARVLGLLLALPDVVESRKRDVICEQDWPQVERAVVCAIDAVEAYRRREGEALAADMTARVQTILALEDEIEAYEPERAAKVREKICKTAEELRIKLEPERFEQEMVYYLEKFDITEEKVRLRQHGRYFLETMREEEFPGRKLGFIIQEMGREINTTGSKASHAEIQRRVVRMKDELEKIREQSMNIL